ncbi:hypothetical protein ACN42_g6740 [Penicillium freii]|uniref:Uncharacterized protein n=1 Tax=Penicillium freii TaxID=48697 RepID=A0A124GR80_PENFR|nr:hypothetical protein ACN42_g6740 [Penicillium freii]
MTEYLGLLSYRFPITGFGNPGLRTDPSETTCQPSHIGSPSPGGKCQKDGAKYVTCSFNLDLDLDLDLDYLESFD